MDYISQTFKNRRRSAYLSADPDPEETAERLMRLFDSTVEDKDEPSEKSKKPDNDNKTRPIVTQPTGQPAQSLFDWERLASLIGLGAIAILLVVGGLTLLNAGVSKEAAKWVS